MLLKIQIFLTIVWVVLPPRIIVVNLSLILYSSNTVPLHSVIKTEHVFTAYLTMLISGKSYNDMNKNNEHCKRSFNNGDKIINWANFCIQNCNYVNNGAFNFR